MSQSEIKGTWACYFDNNQFKLHEKDSKKGSAYACH